MGKEKMKGIRKFAYYWHLRVSVLPFFSFCGMINRVSVA